MLDPLRRLSRSNFASLKKRNKKSFSSANFNLVLYNKEEFKPSKFAVVVTTAVSKKSTTRNKLKRRVRAVLYSLKNKIKNGFAIIIYTKKGSQNLDFYKIKKQIIALLKKSKVLKND